MAAMAAYSFSDTLMKLLLHRYSLNQSNVLRAIFRVGFLLLSRPTIKFTFPRQHLIYWVLALARTYCFIYAIKTVPLATISIISYSSSIITLAISKVILRESIPTSKVVGVALCTIGILIALGFDNSVDWLGLAAAIMGSLITSIDKILVTRLSQHSSRDAIILGSNCFLLICGSATGANWEPVDSYDLGIFALAGIFALLAQLLNTQALSKSTGAYLSPYYYTIFIFGTLNDSLFQGTWISIRTLCGIFFVLVASFVT